jgi:protein-tyrosine phosphatase
VDRTLAELAEKSGGQPKVHRGCEFHLSFDNIDHLLRQPSVYTINSKQYLLMECPDFHVGRYTEGVLRRLVDAGLVPIIAHPERNPALRRKLDRVEAWVELGCLLQVTALSVTGGFGGRAKAVSGHLLDRGLVHVIASDAHDAAHRHARLDEAYAAVRLSHGVDTAELLFLDNPEAIVKGLPVPGGKQGLTEPRRKWWRF